MHVPSEPMTTLIANTIKRDTLDDLVLVMEEVATIDPSPSTPPAATRPTTTDPDTEVGKVRTTMAGLRSLSSLKTTTDGKPTLPLPTPLALIQVLHLVNPQLQAQKNQ